MRDSLDSVERQLNLSFPLVIGPPNAPLVRFRLATRRERWLRGHIAELKDEGEMMSGGVRAYALDPERAKALWAKGEEMVGERF